jgi:hypothetical protein
MKRLAFARCSPEEIQQEESLGRTGGLREPRLHVHREDCRPSQGGNGHDVPTPFERPRRGADLGLLPVPAHSELHWRVPREPGWRNWCEIDIAEEWSGQPSEKKQAGIPEKPRVRLRETQSDPSRRRVVRPRSPRLGYPVEDNASAGARCASQRERNTPLERSDSRDGFEYSRAQTCVRLKAAGALCGCTPWPRLLVSCGARQQCPIQWP